jgi:2-(3-amino-3-carboxypropyl)histidine synthase
MQATSSSSNGSTTAASAPQVASASTAVAAGSMSDPSCSAESASLLSAVRVLPSNYDFEIPKTIARIRSVRAATVALQFPEGLLMYAAMIADILSKFSAPYCTRTIILGDVTYGACCVDDFAATALGAQLLVHYGHSCLVPIDEMKPGLSVLYVFVEIGIDAQHLIDSLCANFAPTTRLIVAGTIQFAAALHRVAASEQIRKHFTTAPLIPQGKPLSRGEVLGCTSPDLLRLGREWRDATVVFVADGRFHLESLMIHNSHLSAFYKYDPYNKKLTRERYDHEQMKRMRAAAIQQAKKARKWGIVLGTLGRQGNTHILSRLCKLLESRHLEYTILLMSEIFPDKLRLLSDVEAWVQIACPRLSIDW